MIEKFYKPQPDFEPLKRLLIMKRNITNLLEQTLKDVEKLYRAIVGFDMAYDEYKNFTEKHGTMEIINTFISIDLTRK